MLRYFLAVGGWLLLPPALATISLAYSSNANPVRPISPIPTGGFLQDPDSAQDEPSKTDVKSIVRDAFLATHDGWSADEVLLQEERNDAFLKFCRKKSPTTEDRVFNLTLLNLRKAGQLKVPSTRRKQTRTDDANVVAEMACRFLQDKYQVSTDQLMATPELRQEFGKIVRQMEPEIDLYVARKAAFRLRKSRQLKPELLSRVVDWNRKIETHSVADLKKDISRIQEGPGVYIFRDATGFLYIGESKNLRTRLKKHFEESHNLALAGYLKKANATEVFVETHAFDPKSNARKASARKAYESSLIASRKPRFNILP